ncbi:DUF456 domain-containing protein, partial [Streptococcus suis]
MTTVEVLVAVVIVVGIAGTVVPVVPGSLLVAGAVTVWAVTVADPVGWA